MKICGPALTYLILSVISILVGFAHQIKLSSLIMKVFFVLAWTWFLNYLCKEGHKDVAWFLVIMPFIFMLAMFVIVMETLARHHR